MDKEKPAKNDLGVVISRKDNSGKAVVEITSKISRLTSIIENAVAEELIGVFPEVIALEYTAANEYKKLCTAFSERVRCVALTHMDGDAMHASQDILTLANMSNKLTAKNIKRL